MQYNSAESFLKRPYLIYFIYFIFFMSGYFLFLFSDSCMLMPSWVRSPPNRKTFWNSKQDVAWQVQPITLSRYLALGIRKVDCFYTCSVLELQTWRDIYIYFLSLWAWETISLNPTRIQIKLQHKRLHSQCKRSWKLTRRDFFLIFPGSECCGGRRRRVICPASFIDEELEGSWSLMKSRVLQINLTISFIFFAKLHTSSFFLTLCSPAEMISGLQQPLLNLSMSF